MSIIKGFKHIISVIEPHAKNSGQNEFGLVRNQFLQTNSMTLNKESWRNAN